MNNKHGKQLIIRRIYPGIFSDNLEKSVRSALDCIVTKRKAIYLSSEVTTGKNLFCILTSHGVNSTNSFIKKYGKSRWNILFDELVRKNILRSTNFQRKVALLSKDDFILNPCHLRIRSINFGAVNYMFLWEIVIREKVSRMYFNLNWQYSSGCLFEFILANELKLRTYHIDRELEKEEAVHLINRAYEWIKKRRLLNCSYKNMYEFFFGEGVRRC